MTLSLIQRADRYPDRLAIIAPEGRFTYADLVTASASVAGHLLAGREDLGGERVCLLTPPGWDYVAATWGIWRAGGMAVPLAVSHPPPELAYVLDDAQPGAVVAHPTLADKIASNVLRWRDADFTRYSFLDRGSDERQYCSPGVDLPLVTLCRSKYGTYPEYHTSLDNLDLVTSEGLRGGYEMVREFIDVIENNCTYRVTCFGEPQLGKRGLYPDLSTKTSGASVETMMDFLAYADGSNDLIDISNIIEKPVWQILPIAEQLANAGLVEECYKEHADDVTSHGRVVEEW